MDMSSVQYSRNDQRLDIKIPKRLNADLAHFLGIHMGDGHLSIQRRGTTVDYHLAYHGHKSDEEHWYFDFLTPLFQRIFNKKVNPRFTKNTVVIEFRSKAITTFLHNVCGVPSGSKANCQIPKLISGAPLKYRFDFLRGLADTDFSVTFKKRKTRSDYPVIFYQTPNRNLVNFAKQVLIGSSMKISSGNRIQIRNGRELVGHYLQISGHASLNEWLKTVGFSSSKHLERIRKRGLLGPRPPPTRNF